MFIVCAILAILVFLLTGGIGFPVSIVLLIAGVVLNRGDDQAEAV